MERRRLSPPASPPLSPAELEDGRELLHHLRVVAGRPAGELAQPAVACAVGGAVNLSASLYISLAVVGVSTGMQRGCHLSL